MDRSLLRRPTMILWLKSASAWKRGLIGWVWEFFGVLRQASRRVLDCFAAPAYARPQIPVGLRLSNYLPFPGSPNRRPERRRSARDPRLGKTQQFPRVILPSEMRRLPSP